MAEPAAARMNIKRLDHIPRLLTSEFKFSLAMPVPVRILRIKGNKNFPQNYSHSLPPAQPCSLEHKFLVTYKRMSRKIIEDNGGKGATKRSELLIVCSCLVLFVIQGFYFLTNKSITFDEGSHFAAAVSAWKTGDFRIYSKNPPLIRMTSALPLAAGGIRVPLAEGWQQGRGIILLNQIAEAHAGRFHNLVIAERLGFWKGRGYGTGSGRGL
jgi:hypothetical protein